MKQEIIEFKAVQIVCSVNEQKEVFVPIKPICQALGIDDKTQRDVIADHAILNSVGVLIPSTGADGKRYEMLNLPLRFIFGWLLGIDARKVKPESRGIR